MGTEMGTNVPIGTLETPPAEAAADVVSGLATISVFGAPIAGVAHVMELCT